MSIPEQHESISTNLPLSHLEHVLKALENGSVKEVPETHSLFVGSGDWEIDFEGARYSISEHVEIIDSVRLILANSIFLQSLIDTLEEELCASTDARDYKKAEKINDKIVSLEGVSQTT